RVALDRLPQRGEELDRLGHIDAEHLDAAVGVGDDQAVALERAQRLAHRRAADADALRDVDLPEPGAGRHVAAHDRGAELVGDALVERARLDAAQPQLRTARSPAPGRCGRLPAARAGARPDGRAGATRAG